MTRLIYSFRTFPDLEGLRNQLGAVFIFGKLKEDLDILKQQLLSEHPEVILGIAVTSGSTVFEPVAVNRFGKDKSIIKHGPLELKLHAPPQQPLRKVPTTSFCNWTMYQIQYFINENNLDTKLIFTHIKPNNLEVLRQLLK